MNAALAFSADALMSEVVTLSDGRLAERCYNSRKGKMGWMVYSQSMVREAWMTDRQMERCQ